MKNFKLFLITILTLGLTACSSDDDNNTVVLDLATIAGTYDVVFYEGSEIETDAGTSVVVKRSEFTTDTFTNTIYTFNSNGTFSRSGSFRITETETVTGQNSTTSSEIDSFDDVNVAFSVNTTSRTITLDGEVYDVTQFNGTNLRFTIMDSETVNGNIVTEEVEYRLVKQN